jgi:hypothetical protein
MTDQKGSIPSRGRLELVPVELAEAIRAAALDEDADRLYELVDGVAEHDAEVAEYVRGLISDIAYEVLEDLFDTRGR